MHYSSEQGLAACEEITGTGDLSHYPAFALDDAGNMGQSDVEGFENNSAIRNFQVSPETINNFTGPDLTFSASFDTERNWKLEIFKVSDGSLVDEYSGDGDLSLEDGLGPVDTEGWLNSNYTAVLTVIDNGDTGEVDFRILRGWIYPPIIADLDYFNGENTGIEPFVDDDWEFEDFLLDSDEYETPIPIIKDGKGEVHAKLGSADFPEDVEYRLCVCTPGSDGYLIPVQIITSSDVPHDAEGWAKKESDGIEVENLGIIDLSMLENGSYFLELSVRCNGHQKDDYAQFILDCPLKIGNVRFSQEDLAIETGGLPLRVVRTYDSSRRHKEGDFGPGWSYSIANLEIELDETREWMFETDGLWNIDYTSPISTRFGGNETNRNVTLTLPDGRRATFFFYLRPYSSIGRNTFYTAEYQPMPGIDAQLHAVGYSSNVARWDDGTPKEVFVASTLIDSDDPVCWWEGVLGTSGVWETGPDITRTDPAQYDFYSYVLIMADGTEYHFERERLVGDYEGCPEYLCYGGEFVAASNDKF